jgi:hypothetical protein
MVPYVYSFGCLLNVLFLNTGHLFNRNSLHKIHSVPRFDSVSFNCGFGLSMTFLSSFTPNNQEMPVPLKDSLYRIFIKTIKLCNYKGNNGKKGHRRLQSLYLILSLGLQKGIRNF